MRHTTNCIKGFLGVEPPSHDPKVARLESHIEKLEKERHAANETIKTMRTRTIDYQEHWSKCLSQIYDLTAEIRHYQSSLANSEQIIDALAQERQDLYAREHQNDQMLGAFRARYQMYKEQFDEQNEMIKGLRGDLRKAQEENRVLQGEALGRTDRCLRLAEDVGEARMERAGVLRLMEVERGKNRDAQRVLEVENERLRAELEELRGQTKG